MSEVTEQLNYIENEQKIIHLMLKSSSVIDEMLEMGLSANFFDESHTLLVDAIYQEYMTNGSRHLLTRDSYRQRMMQQNMGGDILSHLRVYDKCLVGTHAKVDDLGYLKNLLVEGYVGRNCNSFFRDFRTESKKSGFLFAARNLVDRLHSSINLTETRRNVFTSLQDMKDEFMTLLDEKRKDQSVVVRCGIPEIDDAVNVGFRPQHLTLFVADVGGGKTNAMLNIALNIYERGHSVLFIPLEMDRIDLMNRIIANKLNINYNLLARPDLLTDEQVESIKNSKLWLTGNGRFFILDAAERSSVSDLKREIEKHAFVFKPQVVIIDYIANLRSETKYNGRNDLEIGEILKSLRFLGKKYGFHIISAAQMGRSAIKAMREGKDDAVDSTAIHGSHQYSADSDTIFALMRVKDEPDKVKLLVIKARHGPSGNTYELRVDPAYARISSVKNTLMSDPDGLSDLESDLNETPQTIVQELNKTAAKVDFVGTSFGDDLPDVDDVSNLG